MLNAWLRIWCRSDSWEPPKRRRIRTSGAISLLITIESNRFKYWQPKYSNRLTALLARIAAAIRSFPLMSLTSTLLLDISGLKPNKPCGYTRSPIRTHRRGEFCKAHGSAASFSMETFASFTKAVRRREETSHMLHSGCGHWAAVFPPGADGLPFARSSTTLWKATST